MRGLFGRGVAIVALVWVAGCGTVKSRSATEQLLISDAVDRCVAQLDFTPLAGQKVFFETRYLQSVKGTGFVNADYIIRSLRQQMVAAHCLLEETPEQANYVVEARVGALGSDDQEVNYGLPSSNALSTAATLLVSAPMVPAVPEISLARRNDFLGAAKLAVFAYDYRTKRPVWQSGVAKGESTAKAIWLFGAGPFQRGTLYEQAQVARAPNHARPAGQFEDHPLWTADSYYQMRQFPHPRQIVRTPPPAATARSR